MFDEMIALIVATAILRDVEVTIIEILDGPKMSTLSLPFFLRRENALPSDFWRVGGASRAWRVGRVGGSPGARGRAPLGVRPARQPRSAAEIDAAFVAIAEDHAAGAPDSSSSSLRCGSTGRRRIVRRPFAVML